MDAIPDRPLRILLVEDNPADVKITQRAFREGRLCNELYVVRDGQDALDYLYHRGSFQKAEGSPEPDLILLDLNLPGINGREVLQVIKQDPKLRRIPVVVLTTSDQPQDIEHAYRHGANTYIQKPVEFEQFAEAVVTLKQYWTMVAKLPARQSDTPDVG